MARQIAAIAIGNTKGHVAPAQFGHRNKSVSTFRSILYFQQRTGKSQSRVIAGPGAISAYLDDETKGRLVLSNKAESAVVNASPLSRAGLIDLLQLISAEVIVLKVSQQKLKFEVS